MWLLSCFFELVKEIVNYHLESFLISEIDLNFLINGKYLNYFLKWMEAMQNCKTLRQPLLGELAMSRKRERKKAEKTSNLFVDGRRPQI
jgi:hypothetical protein